MAIGANTSEQRIKVKVFIEGVEVPFEQVTVMTNGGGGIADLPTATISVPPLPGMSDISRYYKPKVHVFYRDLDYVGPDEDETKSEYRLLFSGIIASTGYARASGQGARASLSFQCVHKNMVLDGVNMQYNGRSAHSIQIATSDGLAVPLQFNSQQSILRALKGVNTTAAPSSLANSGTHNPGSYEALTEGMQGQAQQYIERIGGMPGVLLNYWNQIKTDMYTASAQSKVVGIDHITEMYVPLIEDGVRYFDRMSGHSSLESEIEGSRENLELKDEDKAKFDDVSVSGLLVPPSLREVLAGAAGSHVAMMIMKMGSSFTGETTSLQRMMDMILKYTEYDALTLASPARKDDGLPAIETIVKPNLDFYYAPKCNVLTQNLYDSIQVSEQSYGVPTRVVCNHSFRIAQSENLLKYRAPQTVREAIATTPGATNLSDTLVGNRDGVGKYEWGTGVRPLMIEVPPWLQYMYAGKDSKNLHEDHSYSVVNSDLDKVISAYKAQYGDDYPNNLVPWHPDSGLTKYQRLLMASVENAYAKAVSSMRRGTVSGVFNPYVIAGYPMDILGPDETSPSYHAICDNVTHTITPSSINTSYSISYVMTFEEMYNYYLPPLAPWLMSKLGFEDKLSIIDNPTALAKATEFYASTLGVGAAPIDELHDFNTGKPKAIIHGNPYGSSRGRRTESFMEHPQGFQSLIDSRTQLETNPNLTVQGSLNLVKREIETMADYERDFGVTFIEVDFKNYTPTVIRENVGVATGEPNRLEPGASQYLDYEEIELPPSSSSNLPEEIQINPTSIKFKDFLGR